MQVLDWGLRLPCLVKLAQMMTDRVISSFFRPRALTLKELNASKTYPQVRRSLLVSRTEKTLSLLMVEQTWNIAKTSKTTWNSPG